MRKTEFFIRIFNDIYVATGNRIMERGWKMWSSLLRYLL